MTNPGFVLYFCERNQQMSNFMDYRKKANASSLSERMERMEGGRKNYKDDRIWKLSTDKSGKGAALIRFLPPTEGEENEIVQVYKHSFGSKSAGFFIENCPTTIGQKCPVCEANSALYEANRGDDAKGRTRNLKYYANIIVLEDKANPENNGKVFIYEFGKQIFDKIKRVVTPESSLDVSIPDPFCPINGANFVVRAKKVAGFLKYDESAFVAPSPLFDGDNDKINGVWKKQYPLAPFVHPSAFKSYAELKNRFDKVTGKLKNGGGGAKTAEDAMESSAHGGESPVSEDVPDGQDPLEYFKNME